MNIQETEIEVNIAAVQEQDHTALMDLSSLSPSDEDLFSPAPADSLSISCTLILLKPQQSMKKMSCFLQRPCLLPPRGSQDRGGRMLYRLDKAG